MLDMGFIHDLRKIATILPRARQTLFFSATMPPAIEELAAQFLDNPEKVSVAPQSTTAERVEQAVIHVDQAKKRVRPGRHDAVGRALELGRRHHFHGARDLAGVLDGLDPSENLASLGHELSRDRRSRA
jgi:ATP-dependent RNA helicase RhlE